MKFTVRAVASAGAVVFLCGVLVLLAQSPRPRTHKEVVDTQRGRNGSISHSVVFKDNSTLIFRASQQFFYHFASRGALFGHSGVKTRLSHGITTSQLFSFSPWVERRVRKIFADPPQENVFYANSPAIFWLDNKLLAVLRIWLDRERYEKNNTWPANQFKDNYLYAQTFDANLQPQDHGALLGIPTSGAFSLGDGPIEPRLFPLKDRLLVSFNTGVAGPKRRVLDFTLIWDYTRGEAIFPNIVGPNPIVDHAPENDLPRDKHWAAFNTPGGDLHFVHNIDPLRVMDCDEEVNCKFVHMEGEETGAYNDYTSHIRGGTPFVHYSGKYYVSYAHTTLFKKLPENDVRRYYSTHLVVLWGEPPYRIVYVGANLLLHNKIMTSVPIVRADYIEDPFIFPVGLLLENFNTAVLGVHVNDFSAVLIRITGLAAIMSDVMRLDADQIGLKGPDPGTLNNYVLAQDVKDTGYTFWNE